jgi:hypothetical protein
LNRRNGRYAANVSTSISFIFNPLKNASGSQISEQMLRQKLSRTLSRLMNASSRSYNLADAGSATCPALRLEGAGTAKSAGVPEMIVGVPGAEEGPGRDGSAGSSIFSLKSETMICDIPTLRPEQTTSFVAVTQSFNHHPANYQKPTTPFSPA